ncbi:hypothetical protein P2318_25940 [Myxococcaceae bacterium GXIMD 01537]
MRLARVGLLLVALGVGCREEKPPPPPLKSLAPEPLPALVAAGGDGGTPDDSLYRVAPAPVYGEPVPADALRLDLAGESVRLGAASFHPARPEEARRLAGEVKGRRVLVVPDADTFLAQVSELLAALRESAAQVWLAHPDAPVAYPLVLRDERGFEAWLAEVAPGKLRVIQRADGLELTTNMGKVAGPDPNGPSIPVRGGKQDIATLRKGLGLLKRRFTTSEELCLVPSFGTEVAQAARALSGAYTGPGEPLFETLCLVYPTPPGARGAGP